MSLLPNEVLKALEEVHVDLQKVGRDIEPNTLREVVRYYIERPGKLLRPILLLTFSYSINRRSVTDWRIIQAATIVELLHIVSLLQDDVMDRHEERRGVKTPRVAYGDSRSIVASDWLIAESIKRAVQLGPEVVEYLTDVAQRLAKGQALDLDGEYEKAAEYKTAPLIEAALVLPAMVLGRRDILDIAKSLGRSLGVLYQYSDDISDEKATRGNIVDIATEVKTIVLKLKNIVGDALQPFEKLIKYLVEKALEGTLTLSRNL
ncbi:MAG: polyprenyl synthetase family protein [Pyrobaculum sp.]